MRNRIQQHHLIKNESRQSHATPLAVTQTYYVAIAGLITLLFLIS